MTTRSLLRLLHLTLRTQKIKIKNKTNKQTNKKVENDIIYSLIFSAVIAFSFPFFRLVHTLLA